MPEKKSSRPARSGDHFSGREKEKDTRVQNIVAARAVADAIRTSLGPKGMDKMITQANGDVIITNDGATIMSKMNVTHPAAKMVTDISKAQDVEAGDGTTSVVVMAGAMMEASLELLEKGIHPSAISNAYKLAVTKAEEYLKNMAIPLDLNDRQALINAAVTSLSSKVVSDNSELLAPLAVDAVLKITDNNIESKLESKAGGYVDLDDIKVVKKLGGTIEDTSLVDGLVFDTHVIHSAGGPTRVQNAKIGLIQFCLSAPKTDMDNNVVVSDYQQMDRILKEERRYILKMIKKIYKAGCNVLLIQKSILRDAVNDLSLHYLAKKKIMVIKDIERTDIEWISKTLGCQPIAHPDGFTADKLGGADLAEELSTSGGKVVKITGVRNPGRTVTVLCRGSNRLVIDEAERSIHDALCVVRCLVKEGYLLPGGAAAEMEVSVQLTKYANSVGGIEGYCIRKYAESLEVIPYTLGENAGLHPIKIVTELRRQHNEGNNGAGINVRKGRVQNLADINVLQPLLVTKSAMRLATETCRAILKIDDMVPMR